MSGAEFVVYLGMSLDGFLARPDHTLDFLESASDDTNDGGKVAGERFNSLLSSVDCLVMGRKTFDVVEGFGAEAWPYGETPVIVITSNADFAVPSSKTARNVWTFVPPADATDGGVEAIEGHLKDKGLKRAYIDGGTTVRRFLAARRVTEMTLTRLPIAIGEGVPLFDASCRGPGGNDLLWRHLSTEVLPGGAVSSKYVPAA